MATPDDAIERATALRLRRGLGADPDATLASRETARLAARVRAALAPTPLPMRTVPPAGLVMVGVAAAAVVVLVAVRAPQRVPASPDLPLRAAFTLPREGGPAQVRLVQQNALQEVLVAAAGPGRAPVLPGGGRVFSMPVANFESVADLTGVTFAGGAPTARAPGYGGGLALRIARPAVDGEPVELRVQLPAGERPGTPVALTAWVRAEGARSSQVALTIIAGGAAADAPPACLVEPGRWRWVVFPLPARRLPAAGVEAAFRVSGGTGLLVDRIELWYTPVAP